MDLSLDKLRELLENFLADTGGRRGREREQQRRRSSEAGEEGGDLEDMDLDDDFVMGGGDGGGDLDDLGLDDDFVMGGGGGGGRPDASDIDDDEVVDDLYHRIETLEDELDRSSSELGAIQDSQQHVSEQVEDINDTVRRLLGVYDRLTDQVNPFTGEGETEEGFGVFGEDDGEFADAVGGPADATPVEGADHDDPAPEGVTFSDLRSALEDAEDGEEIPFEEDDEDTRVEVQATDSVDEPEGDEGAVTLDSLAETYATDIIVFEWLTHLVRTGGPAATLRAISYYHEIGWIEGDVRDQLEATLSGPDLDIHVDPGTTPEELSAEDHADSYTYIMKLNEIHETKREVEP